MSNALVPRFLLAGAALLPLSLLHAASPAAAQEEGADGRVAALIERLADPRYAERADAQRRLRDEGLHAFDALLDATGSTDPEVASACRRLLGELTLSWEWLGDPPEVRKLLSAYGELGLEERLETARLLRGLRGGTGVPALARIGRFDPSPRVSREAALVLIETERLSMPGDRLRSIAEANATLDQRYGPSRRPAARWLGWCASPEGVRPEDWRRQAEEERRRLDRNDAQTTPEVVAALLWQSLRAAVGAADEAGISEAVERLATLESDRAEARLGRALGWLAEAGLAESVDRVIERHAELLDTKSSLYLQARLMADRGEADRAAGLAERAFLAETDGYTPIRLGRSTPIDPRLPLAGELYTNGHAGWAIREYAAVGESLEPLSVSAVIARWRLSELQQDAEDYSGASETLAGLDEAINGSEDGADKYRGLVRSLRNSSLSPPSAESVTARRWYYHALSLAGGDRDEQIADLTRAIEADPEDADILIAMHRVDDPPEAFAADVRRRIDTLCQQYDRAIKTSPGNAKLLNVWAWLVGNTEGDYDKAVRYSRRSLELEPGEAGYLDTLGRCLYSAGRLEEAVAVQSEAVAKAPTMQVMQRQLAEFERALAERGTP